MIRMKHKPPKSPNQTLHQTFSVVSPSHTHQAHLAQPLDPAWCYVLPPAPPHKRKCFSPSQDRIGFHLSPEDETMCIKRSRIYSYFDRWLLQSTTRASRPHMVPEPLHHSPFLVLAFVSRQKGPNTELSHEIEMNTPPQRLATVIICTFVSKPFSTSMAKVAPRIAHGT